MDSVEASSYMPPPEFQEDTYEQLVDLNLSDSTELFLIQWPLHHQPEINGQELTLQLSPDGKIGSFVDSTGKSYDLVSTASQEPDATVILSSASESKIVGKISRRVSLVHYMEPEEYEKLSSNKKLVYHKPSGTLVTNSSSQFLTPLTSKVRKNSQSMGRTVSTHGSRHKSTASGFNESISMNLSTPSHGMSQSSGLSQQRNAHESPGSMNSRPKKKSKNVK